jgi:glycosyltransferase involved in cell wall biosynthesis
MKNLRAAWLAPCIGTGGADALMTGLVRHALTADFTGVGILRSHETCESQVAWARKNGLDVPLTLYHDPHGSGSHPLPPPGVEPLPDPLAVARAATVDADIIISWCCGGGKVDMRRIYPELGAPVIELSQNEDQATIEMLAYNAPAAHYYAACSFAAREAFPEALRERVAVIYNGVDPARCTPRAGREALRERLGYAAADRVILFLGRFVAEKNPESIIQALTLLPPEYKALFVGRGPERGAVEDAAKRYAPERVQIMDFVEHPGDLYAGADVFCLPSDFEGDPLAVHEAQLAGLPCVVAEYSAVEELEKTHGELYTRVPRRPTSEQLAEAIRNTVPSAIEEQEYAVIDRARAVTWEHFTLPRIAFQWEQYLHLCLDDWRQTRLYGRAKRLMGHAPIDRAQ